MNPTDDMPEGVKAVAVRLARAKPMRRGSLSERWMKCGKATCACRHDPEARHGPYLSLSRVVGGQTQSRYVDAQLADIVRSQIAAGQDFRTEVEAFWKACEAWADTDLHAATGSASGTEAEKGGSRRTSRTKSRKKSKR